MTIKHNSVAVAAVLAAVATTSIAVPAFAQTKATAGWDTCYAAALERGSGPNRGGGTKEHSQHKAFMDQCMAGKVPLTAERSPPAATPLGGAFASASLPKHVSRHRAAARSRTELAPRLECADARGRAREPRQRA
jgi:uncharacterized membrane protein